MTKFEIVEARRPHCMMMARTMRYEHQAFLMRKHIDIRRELLRLYDSSYYRKAWLIDGELAGLGGVRGDMMSTTGLVWLTITEKAMHYPVAVVKEARRQLDAIMTVKLELDTTISFDDPVAQNFAVYLGFFSAGEFRWRRNTKDGRDYYVQHLNRDPSRVVNCGNHFQIGLIYRGETPDV